MTESATKPQTDELPLAELVARRIEAQLKLAGKKKYDLMNAFEPPLSPTYTRYRFNGRYEWQVSEVEQICKWLNISTDNVLGADT